MTQTFQNIPGFIGNNKQTRLCRKQCDICPGGNFACYTLYDRTHGCLMGLFIAAITLITSGKYALELIKKA